MVFVYLTAHVCDGLSYLPEFRLSFGLSYKLSAYGLGVAVSSSN